MTQADWTGARRPTLPRGALAGAASIAVLTVAAWAALLGEALRAGGSAGAFLDMLCRPVGFAGARAADVLTAMPSAMALWGAMAVGMMLPTAVPMVLAAADRMEETSSRSSAGAVLALLGGYLGVWLAAAMAMAAVQTAGSVLISSLALPQAIAVPAAGLVVGLAGLWQFSAWKQAGLAFCRHPLRDAGVGTCVSSAQAFREGLAQGTACLACCAAMMAAMAAAGVMNVFWMAGMALIMTAEKMLGRPWFTRLLGGALIAAGLILSLSQVGPGTVLRYVVG